MTFCVTFLYYSCFQFRHTLVKICDFSLTRRFCSARSISSLSNFSGIALMSSKICLISARSSPPAPDMGQMPSADPSAYSQSDSSVDLRQTGKRRCIRQHSGHDSSTSDYTPVQLIYYGVVPHAPMKACAAVFITRTVAAVHQALDADFFISSHAFKK